MIISCAYQKCMWTLSVFPWYPSHRAIAVNNTIPINFSSIQDVHDVDN